MSRAEQRLPGYFADCASIDPSAGELLIFETGARFDAARSSRDRMTQAVLGIDSKIVNPMVARIDRTLDNDSFKSIIAAIGAGIDLGFGADEGGITFRPDMVRYGRIIIALDNTQKGAKMRRNLLALFHLYMSYLMSRGQLFKVDFEGVARTDFVSYALNPNRRRLVEVAPDESGIYFKKRKSWSAIGE